MNDKNFYVKEDNHRAFIKQHKHSSELTDVILKVVEHDLEIFLKHSPLTFIKDIFRKSEGASRLMACPVVHKADTKSFTHSEEPMLRADLVQNSYQTDCNFSSCREFKSNLAHGDIYLSEFELKLRELDILCRTILPSDLHKVLKMCNYKFCKIKDGLKIYF